MTPVAELTRALVRVASPNPPGDESGVALELHRFLATVPGVEIRDFEPSPRRVTVVAAAGSGRRCLALAAHTDTHPISGEWAYDALARDGLIGDRIYGRGTTDNKGAVAAMGIAFRHLVESGLPLGRRLLLVANADEETGGKVGVEPMMGAWDERPQGAIVAEASGVEEPWQELYVAARGTTRFSIDVSGTATHSSLAGRAGVRSAVEDLDELLAQLRRKLRVLTRRHPRFGLRGRLTVVSTNGGSGWGVVPGSARADCELRLLPPARQAETEGAVEAAFSAAAAGTGADARLAFAPGGLRWMSPSQAGSSSRLVASAERAWLAVHGRAPQLGCFTGATDARLFEAAGVPSVIAGPGALDRAHHPDEYVTEQDLEIAVRFYEAAARDFLGMGAA